MRVFRTRSHSLIRMLWPAVMLLMLLAGCIRPVENDQTPTPDGDTVISNPSNGGTSGTTSTPLGTTPSPTRDPAEVSNAERAFLRNYVSITLQRGMISETFTILNVYTTPTQEEIFTFSFQNPSRLPCIGAAIVQIPPDGSLGTATGDVRCATEPGTDALAASLLLVSYSGTGAAYITTFGQVFDTTATLGGGTIIFPSGQQAIIQASNVQDNHFLNVQINTFETAQTVTFVDETGNDLAVVSLQ